MCNLYSLTKGQAAIRDWFRASHDRTGNLPLFPGIFPDQMAPIVRNGADGERELVMARWGMLGRRSLEARRSLTSAMSAARVGAAGSASRTAASCPERRFANTRIRSPARRRSGSRLARTVPCSRSLVYGLLGAACEDRRARQSMGSMNCSAFSRQKRMPSSPRFIRRQCLSF
jgi:hypothetical protein